jgi:hypothetical protein
MTVQEIPEFAKEAERLLGEVAHAQLITFLGLNPTAGVIVPATGGVRKLRWAVPGRGKRGGARVIYYFLHDSAPLLALDIYAKSVQGDLTEEQKKQLRMVAAAYAKRHGRSL